jgi:hypothetical protein
MMFRSIQRPTQYNKCWTFTQCGSLSYDTNDCKKIYTNAKPPEESGHFYGQCVQDNSVLDVAQRVSITINYQAATGASDFKTFFLIEPLWGVS